MEITNVEISAFLDSVEEERKADILKLLEMGKRLTNKEPKLWGSIIGFGSLHYKYKTGHEGDMPIFGFANRKQAITLYISYGLEEYEELERLGKFKTGKSCLYIKRLSDVDIDVLEKLIERGIKDSLELSFVIINPE